MKGMINVDKGNDLTRIRNVVFFEISLFRNLGLFQGPMIANFQLSVFGSFYLRMFASFQRNVFASS